MTTPHFLGARAPSSAGSLIKQASAFISNKDLSTLEKLELVSHVMLPVIQELKGPEKISDLFDAVDTIHGALSELDDEDYVDLAKIIRGAPGEDRPALDALSASLTEVNHAEARIGARNLMEIVSSTTEEQHIAFSNALLSILPPGMKSAVRALADGKTVAESVQVQRGRIAGKTLEELAERQITLKKNTPVGAFEKMFEGWKEKVTPESLKIFAEHVRDNLGKGALAQLALSGLTFGEEFCLAAQSGKAYTPDISARGARFGVHVLEVLKVIEDAAVKADLTFDTKDFVAGMVSARNAAYHNGFTGSPSGPKLTLLD